MRIQNSLRNILFGLSGQMISTIMGFLVRTVFIGTLGIQYLGVEGLFSSILIMLSLANLGFDTAMIYSLYKPLAKNDQYIIQALMNLYRKSYRIIGLIVLLIGLSLLPFLPYLMNGQTIPQIRIIYLMFLLNSVSSYYFAYKHSIIAADQRNHIISKIHSVFTIVSNCTQIALLLITKYYLVVLAAQIAYRIIENVYLAKKADTLYPYLKLNNDARLSIEDKRVFFANMYARSLYKISAVVITATPNIVISVIVGITWVGIYSNYLLIIGTLTTFISHIFHSITASVGNLIVTENEEKKYFIFRVINFANFWIFGFCAVTLWSVMNPFISIWLGNDYSLGKFIVFAILLNLFTAGMQDAVTTFRETTGLFNKGKYRPLFAAAINIVFSIILAEKIGVAGVLFGTVISRLCTYFWFDPYIVFKHVFHKPVKAYFLRYIRFACLVAVASLLTEFAGNIFSGDPYLNILIRCMLSLLIPNILFFVFFRRSEEFKYIYHIARSFANRKPSKRLREEAETL